MAAVEQPATFACPSCGKKYKWKPELAGRKAKCTCGNTITTPASLGAAGPMAAAAPARPAAAKPPAARPVGTSKPTAKSAPKPPPKEEDDGLYEILEDEETRAKKAAATAAAEAAAAPSPLPSIPPSFRPPKRDAAADKAASNATLLRLLVPLGFILVFIIAFYSYRILAKHSKTANNPLVGDDEKLLAQIDDEGGTEAKQWLDSMQTRMVSGMTRSQAYDRIQKFYDMGAKKVYAFGGQMSTTLVLELPQDPDARARLFAFEKEWHESMFVKPAKDVGQKYLLLQMKL